MGIVIPMIHTSQARAQGVATAVAYAAQSFGCSPERALIEGRAAKLAFLGGRKSAAGVVADATAKLRCSAPKDCA